MHPTGDGEFLQPETSGPDPALWEVIAEATSWPGALPLVSNPPGRDKGLWLLASQKRRRYHWLVLGRSTSTLVDTAALQGQASFEFYKRLVDVLGSLTLILLLAPLLPALAILIRGDSRGPVLFRQSRVGQNGIRFTIWKFRSMYIHTNKYARSP